MVKEVWQALQQGPDIWIILEVGLHPEVDVNGGFVNEAQGKRHRCLMGSKIKILVDSAADANRSSTRVRSCVVKQEEKCGMEVRRVFSSSNRNIRKG